MHDFEDYLESCQDKVIGAAGIGGIGYNNLIGRFPFCKHTIMIVYIKRESDHVQLNCVDF